MASSTIRLSSRRGRRGVGSLIDRSITPEFRQILDRLDRDERAVLLVAALNVARRQDYGYLRALHLVEDDTGQAFASYWPWQRSEP